MKRTLRTLAAALLALCLLLSLAACEGKTSGKIPGEKETKKPEPVTDEASQIAADLLQQLMDGTNMAAAVAYLGCRDESERGGDLTDWLWTNVPGLMEKMAFLQHIPPERVLNGDCGDLYCIVPRGENASLAVNRVAWRSNGSGVRPETDEVLYRSENAEPLLIFVSREQSSEKPEIEINAVAGNGASVTWYPVVDADSGEYNVPTGEDRAALILDFSRFGDIGGLDYGDDGWFPPTDEGLAGTSWSFDRWELKLSRGGSDPDYSGKAELLYQDTDGAEYKTACSGVWRMEGECLYLELPVGGGTYASGRYPVLIPPSGEYLQIFRDAKTGACPPFFGDDMTSVTLFLSYG